MSDEPMNRPNPPRASSAPAPEFSNATMSPATEPTAGSADSATKPTEPPQTSPEKPRKSSEFWNPPSHPVTPTPADEPLPPPEPTSSRPSVASPTPAPTLNDFTVIHNFRDARPEAVGKINADFGLRFSPESFARLQTYYRMSLRRDPTVGELRLIDAQTRMAEHFDRTHRTAVGEFLTDNAAVAETWADMMDKFAVLHRGLGTRADAGAHILPPCTCEEALSLLGTYLRRTEEPTSRRKDAVDVAVVSTTVKEAEAIVAGFHPVARVLTETGKALTLVARHGKIPAERPVRPGDLLLVCPAPSLHELSALLAYELQKRSPDISAVRLVTGRTLLSAILDLAPAADLYADRLIEQNDLRTKGFLPISVLCGLPSDVPAVVLRVPVRSVYQVTETWKKGGLSLIAVGQVSPGDRVVIRLRDASNTRDDPVVILPSALLAGSTGRYLHHYRLPSSDTPAASLRIPALSRLPGLAEAENGLCPNGREAVALTVAPSSVLYIPEEKTRLTAVSATITDPATAYRTGYEAVVAAVTSLAAPAPSSAGWERPYLTVELTAAEGEGIPGDGTLALICGLYRAAAERGLPIEDPVLKVLPAAAAPATPLVSLMLTAWVREKRPEKAARRKSQTTAEPTVSPMPDELQWSAGLQVRHKESPAFYFPVLHRSFEGSLRALTTALNRCVGAACSLHPVATETVAVEVADPASTPMTDPATPSETHIEHRQMLHPTAIDKLVARITGDRATPVFSMNDADARLLLSNAAIRDALELRLEAGYPTVVLGEACRVFAEYGYLPEALTVLSTVPAAGCVAEVTYRLEMAPDGPVDRLVRQDLLSPATGGDGLLTIRLPNGRTLPDGFVGREGLVLGLLNGLDAVMSDVLVRPFQRFHINA